MRFDKIKGVAVERSKVAARQADDYVHEHPWESIAIGAGVAAVVGIVLGLLISRR
jgi:ElaB/YqjD/DUF883 family membrane-anchored ribosome-binding protein